jgi:uncharacterized protein (TIGR00251 family)
MATRSDGRLLAVRVQPGAGRDEIVGWQQGVLRVRVAAPALEGRANRALGAVLATALGVPVSRVTVVRGEKGRRKLVRVTGLASDEIRARLERHEGGVR